MKLEKIIRQPEGRRLEFKQELPTVADLAKTIVAFANDAGGELYVGVRNEPREIVGVAEKDLLIADELKAYPEIDFKWFEKGLALQVQFINKNFVQESQQELQQELEKESLYTMVLKQLLNDNLNTKEISEQLGQKEISGQLGKIIKKLMGNKLISKVIPDNPTHPAQKHKLTERGELFLKLLIDGKNK